MKNKYINRFKFESNEVLYTTQKLENFNKSDIMQLKQLANKNKLKKIRICSHKNKNSIIQDMLILHNKLYNVLQSVTNY